MEKTKKKEGENPGRWKIGIERTRNQITDRGRELGGGGEQLEPEEMIAADAAKGKAALGNGITCPHFHILLLWWTILRADGWCGYGFPALPGHL
jgi:hypothetical protein